MVTRRRFLRQTFGYSAAAVLAGAAAPSALAGAASPAAAKPQPAGDGPVTHLFAVGDCGVKRAHLARQRAVSEGMARYARNHGFRPGALALLGDNFYGGLGRAGVRSSRWNANVESMYPADPFPGPIFGVLGNHDYRDGGDGGSVAAQLAYAGHNQGTRWSMPHKWYRFDLAAPADAPDADGVDSLATVLVVDTNFVFNGGLTSRERKRQEAWLKEQLSAPRRGRWMFVFGHHPLYSNGSHGDTRSLIDHLDPLLRRHKVDLYLCGHDHDLQHIELKNHPTSFVVSGAGGARARAIRDRKRGAFAKSVYGFTHLEVRRDQFAVRHVDANGAELHAFRKLRTVVQAVRA